MTRKRLFSSNEIIAALLRAGFTLSRRSKGSHQAMVRQRPDSGHDVAILPLGKPEIPRGTLDSILEQAHIDYEEFLRLARVRRKGRE